jgi:hypothetical protein
LTKEKRRDEAGQRQIIQQELRRWPYAHLDVLLGHILRHIINNHGDFRILLPVPSEKITLLTGWGADMMVAIRLLFQLLQMQV